MYSMLVEGFGREVAVDFSDSEFVPRSKQIGLVVELRSLIIRLQSEGDYYIDPGLVEKALLAAGESARSG